MRYEHIETESLETIWREHHEKIALINRKLRRRLIVLLIVFVIVESTILLILGKHLFI